MKKELFLIGFLTLIALGTLCSQHTVGDVREHGGWYSVRFEFNQDVDSFFYCVSFLFFNARRRDSARIGE